MLKRSTAFWRLLPVVRPSRRSTGSSFTTQYSCSKSSILTIWLKTRTLCPSRLSFGKSLSMSTIFPLDGTSPCIKRSRSQVSLSSAIRFFYCYFQSIIRQEVEGMSLYRDCNFSQHIRPSMNSSITRVETSHTAKSRHGSESGE